ncbi:hypothetical protein BTS2_0951 [Bacillus sp. TS-2]|nr:hypothetical protein BTS2_0951 [Bacillus sp. TS-2]
MGDHSGKNTNDQDLIQLSEDLIYYSTILSTLSSIMSLIGVMIARDVSQRESSAEAEDAASLFSASFRQPENTSNPYRDYPNIPDNLHAQMHFMRTELNRVNKELRKLQLQLDSWKRP